MFPQVVELLGAMSVQRIRSVKMLEPNAIMNLLVKWNMAPDSARYFSAQTVGSAGRTSFANNSIERTHFALSSQS